MNCVRQQDKLALRLAGFVAAMVVLTLAGATITAQGQTYTVLYQAPNDGLDPENPGGQSIAQGRDGNLYFGSYAGGTASYGTLFNLTPAGKVAVVYPVGDFTQSGATLGTDGNFYGTNRDGGSNGDCFPSSCGQVYKITPGGVQTILHTFTNSDGYFPVAAPIEGTDGKFYGTVPTSSGTYNSILYSVTPSGTFTMLHTFTSAEGQNVTAGLIQGTDGNFYGVAVSGGANNYGSIFKMTSAGAVTVLHSFDYSDGANPYYPLVQASDGSLYGSTYNGGLGVGVIFKITASGAYSVLHELDVNAGDGEGPNSSLTQGSDGKLYGVTGAGPNGHSGTIFNISTTGTFTTLYTFCPSGNNCTDGVNPQSPVRQNTNGTFYGTTVNGGDGCNTDNCGVVFSLNMGLGPFVGLVNTSGKEGSTSEILGQGFDASSTVKFGGVLATSIKRIGTTFIAATVPAGALTGTVTVTTGAAKLTSNQQFRVTPQVLSFTPPSGPVGTSVTITGVGLTQTLGVGFGDKVPATNLKVISDTEVTADVPEGAKTGKVGVETKGGIATSTGTFTVN